jgi:hypothetical protein
METIEKLNGSKWTLLIFTGGMFSLMLVLNILTPYICDDFTYNINFSTKEPLGSYLEIFESMYAHSYKMNGRLISHGLAQVFMLLPPLVFDICNAAVFTGTLLLICRLCGTERNALLLVLTFCLFWNFLPVFGQVVLWQVGALNYFWSLTALLLFVAPELLRFLEDRELLKKKWHWVAFCVYGFFFGWYSEIASFVGLCMVPCLLVLDALMNRRKLQLHRFLPVLTGAMGYIVMLSMPAQSANKAAYLRPELLMQRFSVCNEMLKEYLLVLLILFGIMFLSALVTKGPRKTTAVSALFALAGVCANYMPLAASYYPERCLCVPVLMLIMAILFLWTPISRGRGFHNFCLACLLIFCLTVPKGLRGSRDILSCHRQHVLRESIIAEAIENGERDVVANVVIPETPWSGYWGVRDLVEDPETWPNHSMAMFYGLDSLIGK